MIRVLIVDGSSAIRVILTRELSKQEELEVVGVADNPYTARDMIIELNPDIVVMGFKMPIMDGLTFLKKLMKYYPLPVIMISAPSLSLASEAKKAGAVDLFYSPQRIDEIKSFAYLLAKRIKSVMLEKQELSQKTFNLAEKYLGSLIDIFEDEVKSIVMTSLGIPNDDQGVFFTKSIHELDTEQAKENIEPEKFEIDYFMKKSKGLFIN